MKSELFSAENVESYLKNELSPEEKLRFEIKLQEDKDFAEFVSLYKEIDFAIAEQDVIELRSSLKSIHDLASAEWIDNAPMIADSFENEVDKAIGQEDVMELRSVLNEIHDLNRDELYEANVQPEFDFAALEELMEEEEFINDDISKAILEDDVMQLRDSLKSIAQEETKTKVRIPITKRLSRLTAAASIALLVLLGATTWYAVDSQPMKPDRAANKHYVPIAKSPTRGGGSNELAIIAKAYNAYNKEDYQLALNHFETLISENPEYAEDMPTKAYIGNCYFFLGNTIKAADEFEKILANGNNKWLQDAEWFLAGCYLRTKDVDEAVIRLHGIAIKPDHKYHEASRKLLKDLKRNK